MTASPTRSTCWPRSPISTCASSAAVRDGNTQESIDVITLSLGYRHETPGAFDDEEALFRVLRGLAELGVTIVAAVGNDASDVEYYPAAYASHVTTGAPMVSVGALNPDHRTVSVYSNTGTWVRTYAAATSVVSTMPTTFNASRRSELLQQANPSALPAVPTRGAVDLDDYSGGFGLWSGTSFAAPALAGDIASSIGAERSVDVRHRSAARRPPWSCRASTSPPRPSRRSSEHRQGRRRPRPVRAAHPASRTTAAQAFALHCSGDSSAMGELVDKVTPLLWHTARSQGADPATAEDVVQTAWLRLVEHASDISDPQAVLQWLLMTTKREAWSAVRRGRRTVPQEPWEEPASGDPTVADAGPDPVLGHRGRRSPQSLIWRHVESLPERCQQLLRLVAFVDRPDYGVVSAALGIPVGSIGPTRGRCLAKLRLALTSDPTWEVTA